MAEEVKEEKKTVRKTTAKKETASKEVKEVKEVKEEKATKAKKPATKKVKEVAEEVAKEVKVARKPRGKKASSTTYIATGRRKDAVARVRLIANGTGKITINNRDIDEYLKLDTLKLIVRQPLALTDTATKYDVIANVYGGGYTGQTGAIRHGIARALVKENETFKAELKKAGFLSRDSRMKERKKYGLKKARKASQFSKR